MYVTPVAESYIVEFRDTAYAAILDSLELDYNRLWWTIYEVNNDSASVYQINDTLCTINPLYLRLDSTEFYMRDIVVLEWKKDVNEHTKQSLISQYQLELDIEAGPLQHYKAANALTVANELFETGNFRYCYPEFLIEIMDQDHIPNDEYFDQQWYLHNTGQLTNDGHYGTPGADIKAPAAWEITTGSPDVVVAVIDRGVTYDHPDLPASRLVIVPFSNNDSWDGLPNDQPFATNNNHGNAVAGVIAATMDNEEGIAGVCPECKIMPFKFQSGPGGYVQPHHITGSIAFNIQNAVLNGAHVISTAQNVNPPTESMVAAVDDAIESGIVFVAVAGNLSNHAQNQNAQVVFPGNIDNPHLICVGASDRHDLQANYSPTSEKVDVVAPSSSALNGTITGEAANIWTIDMPGNPGDNPWPHSTYGGLPATSEQLPSSGINHLAYTGRFGGTSAAAPQVSGIAALILSINPCLTPEKVKKIILNTADKVGPYDYNWNPDRPGHSKEMGYGRVNAHAAVLAASMDIDLYTEDVPGDGGVEPNETSDLLWLSEDIWVRNQPDGLVVQEHENPEYVDDSTPVYVYVRVRNRGCNESLGTEELHLYWSKAGTALSWPEYWDGSIDTPALMGDEIGVELIDPIETNGETIVSFEWYPPNPGNYEDGINSQPWHFCLLSRIIAPHDPMVSELTSGDWNLFHNVKHNNNISWKNVSIVTVEPGSAGGSWDDDRVVGATIAIGNAVDAAGTFDWSFVLPEVYQGKSLLDVAEVRIMLDSLAWQKWVTGGKLGEKIKVVSEPRKQILIEGDSAKLKNLEFAGHERSLMSLNFNFRTRDFDGVYEYDYHVVQSESLSNEILGGEKFEIRVEERELFLASAGDDRTIYRNEQIEISAESVHEDAIYNWYDEQGNRIHTGKDLIVSPQITTTYRLEVIAESDGFKDYDEVQVVVKTAEIVAVWPNPVSTVLTVEYDTKNVQSAHLVLTKVAQSGITHNYLIDTLLNETMINVTGMPFGLYNLILVADGEMVDQKVVSIQ